MKARQPISLKREGRVTADAVRALRALGAITDDPIVLGHFPVARTNPFPVLLYREAWSHGIGVVEVTRDSDFGQLGELARLGHRTVLHMHWLSGVMGGGKSAAEAEAAGRAYLARLDELLAAGAQLAWTVHNVLPHDTPHEQLEAWFRGEVARRMDVIHVMAEDTAAAVAPYFELPADRLLHVPHPNYIGAYADAWGRDRARFELGLMPDEQVTLAIGAIKPYKGLEDLIDAWDALPDDGVPRRLLIAGSPSGEPGVEELIERAALHPRVLIQPERVEAEEMQLFLRSADAVVFPYRRTLNSGALLLALSFGLPVLVPSDTTISTLVDERFAVHFEPGDLRSLVAAIVGMPRVMTPAASAAALETARRFDPVELSGRFASDLRRMLDERRAGR